MRRINYAMGFLLGLMMMLGGSLIYANHSKGNVDELRFGAEVNAEGVVPPEAQTDHFLPGKPIHVTMKVQEARQGTDLVLTILDRETDQIAWTKVNKVPGGHQTMHFIIASLKPGKYRAKVTLGDDEVAEEEFQVSK